MPSTICTRLTLIASLLVMGGTTATADMPKGCYARDYSAAHLAKNPGQTVASIVVQLDDTAPGGGFIGSGIVRALMAPTKSTRAAGTAGWWFDNYVVCEVPGPGFSTSQSWARDDRLTCFAECDGGFFQVLGVDGAELLIRTHYLALPGDGCEGLAELGDESAHYTTYKLYAAPASACAP